MYWPVWRQALNFFFLSSNSPALCQWHQGVVGLCIKTSFPCTQLCLQNNTILLEINVHHITLWEWGQRASYPICSLVAVSGSPGYHEITETSIGYRHGEDCIDRLALFIHSESVSDRVNAWYQEGHLLQDVMTAVLKTCFKLSS